jgi:hypothetical protein
VPHLHVEAYTPREGDMVFFDDHSTMWKVLYKMAGTDMPDHTGIVVTLPDGRPALLEAGPDDGRLAGPYIRLVEATARISTYPGTLWVRRLKTPLTKEQSARLTEFALAQEGKRYAVCRLLLQGTPFRCRGPVRDKLFGGTDLNRCSYLCAELVVAAGTSIGLFDPKIHHANSIYPHDIFDDKTYDLSKTWYPAGLWSPTPTANNPATK